jgi:hypothetical protein
MNTKRNKRETRVIEEEEEKERGREGGRNGDEERKE